MKYLLTILFPLTTFCQTAQWTTGNENSISQYEVQKSTDTLSWSTIATVAKGKSVYTYTLTDVQNYYIRIKASGLMNFYTKSIYMTGGSANRADISAPKVVTSWWTDKLTWTTALENNVNFYFIEKSSNGVAWTLVKNVTAKGSSAYSYTSSRGWFSKKPAYRLKAVYKDGSSGAISTFK